VEGAVGGPAERHRALDQLDDGLLHRFRDPLEELVERDALLTLHAPLRPCVEVDCIGEVAGEPNGLRLKEPERFRQAYCEVSLMPLVHFSTS